MDKKVGETTYFKCKINLPKKVFEDSKFEGKELGIIFDKDKIMIKRDKN